MERDRDPAYAGSDCGTLPACRRHFGRQVIIFKLLKTKQVHLLHFRFTARPLRAIFRVPMLFIGMGGSEWVSEPQISFADQKKDTDHC
ncbi:MAG: hypothetical protein ABSD46_13610 [Bacteroidota bacterium]